ncbi:MAG TPA: MFS transporter [Acidimicrobiales bacterium]|nr:MFS transporter [Acidimicrobiales bacterium]
MSTNAATPGGSPDLLAQLDDSKVTAFQWKIMFVSGMGFFTDAYDLFVIGVVVKLLDSQWHLKTGQTSLLNSTTLAASALGAILFGRISDLLGRKKIYGYEVLVLAAGAIASALAPGFVWLIVFRIILGIGIGGDYPVSATIMSEYSGKGSRGRMVGLVFAMQGAGLVIGPLIAALLLSTGMSHNLIWRILLGIGAIPGLAVFYLRRQIHETPRFAMAGGATEEAEAAVKAATGEVAMSGPAKESEARHQQNALEGYLLFIRNPTMGKWLLGTALCWMVFDFAYYGNSISSPAVLSLVSPNATLLQNVLLTCLIFVVFALPGYALSIHFIDRMGRKPIQIMGFGLMTVAFAAIGLIPGVTRAVVPFVLLYGMSYLFSEFGPNSTTFVYPAELFPVEVRTSGHGISAAAGKMGAFAGAYLFPVMLDGTLGLRGAELVAAGMSVIGLLLTIGLLPEPRGKSLEELTDMAYAPPPGRAVPKPKAVPA